MQELVTTIRSTGATNVILCGGVNFANNLSSWLTYAPTDPLGNVAAAWHVYEYNPINTVSGYNANTKPVIDGGVPVVIGEIGDDYTPTWAPTLLDWADANGVSGYLGWTWNTWGESGPSLINSYGPPPSLTGWGTSLASYAEGV